MSHLPTRLALAVAAALIALLGAAATASADLRIPTLGEATTLSTLPESVSLGLRRRARTATPPSSPSASPRPGSCSSASAPPGPSSRRWISCSRPARPRSARPAVAVVRRHRPRRLDPGVVLHARGPRRDRDEPQRRPQLLAAGDRRASRPATAPGTSRSPPTATTSSSPGATTATASGPRAAATAGARSSARPSITAPGSPTDGRRLRHRRRRPARALGLARRRLRRLHAPLDRRRPHARAGRSTCAPAAPADFIGAPNIDADGGIVAITTSQEYRMPRPDHTGTDFGHQPVLTTSQDGGDTWAEQNIGTPSDRCIGDYCSAPYGLDVDGLDVYVGWRGQGSMWLAHSTDGGVMFDGARRVGRYSYTWNTQQMPSVSARRDTVVVTWHSAPDPSKFDLDPVAAFSSDRGRTFTLRTVDDRPGQDVSPVGVRVGPRPAGRRLRLDVVRAQPAQRRPQRALQAAVGLRARRRRARGHARAGRQGRRPPGRGPPDHDPRQAPLAPRRPAPACRSRSTSPTTRTASASSATSSRTSSCAPA